MPQASRPLPDQAPPHAEGSRLSEDWTHDGAAAAPRLGTAPVGPSGAASPARLMQARLAERIAAEDAIETRWPWRLTVAFVLASCSAFWVTLYAFVSLLVG